MACLLVHPLLWTWLCLTIFVCFFTITSFNQREAPVRTVRKHYLTSEVAANFIQILQSTPAEILPAPCDFIVDSFNHKIKSLLDSLSQLIIKTINTRQKYVDTSKPIIMQSNRQETPISKKIINEHKNNQKFLFSTIDLLTNTNLNKSSKSPTDALFEDFADHFRSKINDIRPSLLP